jgi:hypothetical protein
VLQLQQSVGNRAVQRLLDPGHRPYSPADDHDMRGESDEDESDARPSASPVQRDADSNTEASATGVSLGGSGPIHTDTRYGLRTPIRVRGTDLGNVLDSELVGSSIDHTGSMEQRPSAKSNNSGFMPADNIPDDRHTSNIANHLRHFDDHGGAGSYSRLQMDLYKIHSQGIDEPRPIPNSGYRIKREVEADGDDVIGIVTKTAEAVSIGDKATGPGLTASKQARVKIRSGENEASE